jgi:aspartate racemase
MKTIGLIGGMSWQSTREYYTLINQEVNRQLGGNNAGKIIMYSLNFEEVKQHQLDDNWEQLEFMLAKAAQTLEDAGADIILICANTMHKVYEGVQESVEVKVLHIADSTASLIMSDDKLKLGLLGTMYTMQEGFLKEIYTEVYDLDIIVPKFDDCVIIHDIIINSLCKGVIASASYEFYFDTILSMHLNGCEGVILGCTEIPLLIDQAKFDNNPIFNTLSEDHPFRNFKLYDSTMLHAHDAVRFALE